jgi:hypothetical protein
VSRYKFDRSQKTITVQNFCCGHWRSVGVQFVSEPGICHGAEFQLRADARVRVQRPLQICLKGRSKSKKCDKQLTHIVRVITRYFIFSDSGTSHKDPDLDKWSNESNVLWMAQK